MDEASGIVPTDEEILLEQGIAPDPDAHDPDGEDPDEAEDPDDEDADA